MRRASAVLVTLSLILAPTVHAQSTAPDFHAGQWGARFMLGYGFAGIGALHFSTPDKAWTLMGRVSGSYDDVSGSSTSANSETISLAVGRRWYRAAKARVRPFGGLGVSGGFGRNHQVNGLNTLTRKGYGASFFGELGATIFFAPELSLGASWSAGIGMNRSTSNLNNTQTDQRTSVSASGGDLTLEGAFYF